MCDLTLPLLANKPEGKSVLHYGAGENNILQDFLQMRQMNCRREFQIRVTDIHPQQTTLCKHQNNSKEKQHYGSHVVCCKSISDHVAFNFFICPIEQNHTADGDQFAQLCGQPVHPWTH